jgi:signal transduction histidine kinase
VTLVSDNSEPGSNRDVSVEFRDTGKGMSPSIVGRVFDPFFTTKTSGTDLGPSICHELVRAHSGDIAVESHEGFGTCVRATFSVSRKVPASSALAG